MSEEIIRALELIEKRAHMPDIDSKKSTLMLAYHMQLTSLLTKKQALENFIAEEELSLLKGKSLREGSEEDRREGREQIERHKTRLQKTIEEDKEKVRKILEDVGLV
jgi:hypothetical protein